MRVKFIPWIDNESDVLSVSSSSFHRTKDSCSRCHLHCILSEQLTDNNMFDTKF